MAKLRIPITLSILYAPVIWQYNRYPCRLHTVYLHASHAHVIWIKRAVLANCYGWCIFILFSIGSDDRTVRLWDCDTGACLKIFRTHTVADVKFDSKQIVTASFDNTAACWDMVRRVKVKQFTLSSLSKPNLQGLCSGLLMQFMPGLIYQYINNSDSLNPVIFYFLFDI